MPEGTLLLQVDVMVQPLAAEFAAQPVGAELNGIVKQALQVGASQERAWR